MDEKVKEIKWLIEKRIEGILRKRFEIDLEMRIMIVEEKWREGKVEREGGEEGEGKGREN